MRLRPLLLLLLLLAGGAEAARLPERVVASGPYGEVILRRTSEGSEALVVANRGRPRQALIADQSLEAESIAPIAGARALLVRGWSGGAYCCFTLHLLRETRAGWHLLASVSTGKAEELRPLRDGRLLWLPDAEFDFWDMGVSLGTDLRPPVAWSWRDGRFAPDTAAMRRPEAEAMGEACLRRGGLTTSPRSPPSFSSVTEAATRLPEGEWGQDPRSARSWRPEAEFARRALCLLYAGLGTEAVRLLEAWPADRAQGPETIRQLRARLLCGGYLAVLRSLNGADHPWLAGECEEHRPDLMLLDP